MLFIAYITFYASLGWIIYNVWKRHLYLYTTAQQGLSSLEGQLKILIAKEQNLKDENKGKEETVAKTMSLYEVTKEVSEFLEEGKVIECFTQSLQKFLTLESCDYLATIDSRIDSSKVTVIALSTKRERFGYLVVKGLKENEHHFFEIIVAQLVSGLKRARLYQLVQKLSITDALTKAFTRQHFFGRFNEELRRSADLSLTLSFLMIDIDNFKSFNDTYGHLVGDAILKKTAHMIRQNCREIDLIGRFGGEEFMVALPMTSKEGALFAAERIRKSIESTVIQAFDEKLNVTVSIGVANYPDDAKDSLEIVDKADWALYRSKRTGKNKVSAFGQYK